VVSRVVIWSICESRSGVSARPLGPELHNIVDGLVMTPAHGGRPAVTAPVVSGANRKVMCECLAASGLCSREDRTSPPQAVAPCATAGPGPGVGVRDRSAPRL